MVSQMLHLSCLFGLAFTPLQFAIQSEIQSLAVVQIYPIASWVVVIHIFRVMVVASYTSTAIREKDHKCFPPISMWVVASQSVCLAQRRMQHGTSLKASRQCILSKDTGSNVKECSSWPSSWSTYQMFHG